MAFSWNRFAYTNFHELNLDWFNEHFKKIFEEWEELYNTLTHWKEDTDTDLAQWKTDTLQEMEQWENDLLDALDQWKAATGEDIGEWESGVISDLNDWKADFIEAYEALEDRVEAIVSDTEDMVENLAELFSTSNNYNAGDYVIYNGTLYMFTTDHSAGSWTGSDAVQRTAMNDVADLKNVLSETTQNIFSEKNITEYVNAEMVGGEIINTYADTRDYFSAQALLWNNTTLVQVVQFSSATTSKRMSATFTPESDCNRIFLRHNGNSNDIGVYFNCKLTQGVEYTISFLCRSTNPSTIGGLIIEEIQVESGDVSSLYAPNITAVDFTARRNGFTRPEYYGAKGDGTTDDTEAIRAALASGYNEIRFASKTYKITDSLAMTAHMKLLGEKNAKLIWPTISGETELIFAQNGSDITFENIIFDFGEQNDLRYSISITNSHDIFVKDCEFIGGFGYAWRISNDYNVKFENCSFHDITGNMGNPGGAIYGQDFHDVSFINCSCNKIDDHFVYIAGTEESYNVFVRGCTCIKTGQNGLTNGAAICVYANAHEVIISDNIIKQCRTGVYVGKYGEYTTLPRNVTICQNTITNSTLDGIHVEGLDTSHPCANVHISDNTIYYASQDAIKIAHSIYCTIDNNLVQQPGRYGIALDRVYYATITDCIITDVTNAALIVGTGSSPCLYCRIENIYMTQKSGTYTSYGLYSRQANYCQYINITAIGFATNISYGGGASNNYINAQDNTESKSLYFTNDITKQQYHNVGDVVLASNPTSGNPVMWVCTVAGSPGTMTPVVSLP